MIDILNERLRASEQAYRYLAGAIRAVVEGTYEGRAQRPGKCEHGTWWYDNECLQCLDNHLLRALKTAGDIFAHPGHQRLDQPPRGYDGTD